MARDKDEAEEIIANRIINRGIEIRHRHLFGLELVTELLMLAIQHLVSAEMVNGTMLGGSHEPCARIVRNAGLRPLLECGDEGILGQVLGHTNITDNPCEAGYEPGRLYSPDCIDGAMGIGSVHCYRSHHLLHPQRKPDGAG